MLHRVSNLAFMGVMLSFTGCGSDRPDEFQPSPGRPQFEVVTAEAPQLTSIETDAKSLQGEPTRVQCVTCHARVDVGTPAEDPKQLTQFHQKLEVSHGNLQCASCHEPGEPLQLHLATGERLPMENAMDLCSQCHGPKRASYDDGTHGGMNGYWDLSRGPRLRNQCVHCHDPHTPQIPIVTPVLPPKDRGELPDHNGHSKGHP